MPFHIFKPALVAAMLIWPSLAMTEDWMIDLPLAEPTKWRYFSDQVMGGVSEGQARMVSENDQPTLRLTGDVSTANRGGFVQVRYDLDNPLPAGAQGVFLTVHGNDQPYFVHLRTRGTALPWQYYQAEFDATGQWQEVRLPFAAFSPSGGLLRNTPKPQSIQSLGIVAYGRDHIADVSIKSVGFY
ncbi:CIA30 family protein [Roseovarius sp. 2305UL8-3]|uniref:CIA30 family protein n=1 Tax=Roseovarius conchicola TaxID=3121636 RepID=UPI0035276955